MVLSGTATGDCNCYTLTNTTNQAGSVWSPSSIDLTNPFDFTFRINLGWSDGGADGMAFVLRQSGTFTGSPGTLLGYGGIGTSIGIEVDTWNSDPAVAAGDIPADHIGMNSNGNLNHDMEAAVAIANIEDGVFHDFRVTWDPGTFQMEVFLDGTSIFVHTEDIVNTIFGGSPTVFFGWTGATGGAWNLQQVCIDVEADFTPDDLEACPGQEITFENDSHTGLIYNGIGITSWDWTFGGGDVSDLEFPAYTYETIGFKTVNLTVENMIGCTDVIAVNITVDSIDVSIEGSDLLCFESNDGTATAIPESGDAPFSYLWDDVAAQTTATATGLEPGTYAVLVTDAVGCEQSRSITIGEPDELVLDDVLTTNATCGLADGELILHASGGTLLYQYSINGGISFLSDSNFVGLPDGDLDIIIEDANGCTLDTVVTINSDSLEVDLTFTDVTCFGFNDGTATAMPAFGVGPCAYSWDDPSAQITPTATGLAPGDYEVLVTHTDIGCAGKANVTITEPTELLINDIATINPSCGVSNGQISIEGSGGTLPYVYSIDGGTGFDALPTFTGLAPGAYDIVLKDANDCIVNDNVLLINISNVPEIIIDIDEPDGCQVHEVNIINISDPTLTDITHWEFGDGAFGTGESISHNYTEPGCYDLSMTITTFDGCTTDTTFEDLICVWELPLAAFSFSPDAPDIFNNQVDFENNSENAVTFTWDFGDGTVSNDFAPSHLFPDIGNVTYPVKLVAISDKGCKDSVYQYITVAEVVRYFIPNTFTPNPDPYNQTFNPVFVPGFVPADYHFEIFNRWGETLWESYDPSVGWDGTYGGNLLADDVYTWKLTFRENGSDKKHIRSGHIVLLK